MRRLIAVAASVAILLLAFAPAAFAADPVSWTGRGAIVSVDGTVDVPSGQMVDAVVVVRGSATIEGTVNNLVLFSSTATLTGATAHHLVVVDSTANLGPGTTVDGSIATLHGDVYRDASAVVTGPTTTLDADLGALAIALIPLVIIASIGFLIAMVVAGLALAAFGARQTRTAEDLITRRPGHVLATGLVGTIVLPLFFGALILSVIGAPIGLAMLFIGLPLLFFVGWLVAAIWVGDWLLGQRGTREPVHPYKAAVLGVIVLALLGLFPFVTGIATLFGVGALLVAAWGSIRPDAPAPATNPGWPTTMPTAG
ncbi:MAG TPA: hypothetical protein VIH37_05005 [Candidatus Limnocylindrales bacterium]